VPIYEYECEDCKKVFEAFVGINDPPLKNCPHCNGTRVKKLVSNCSFQLKGSGWYLTDYARKEKKEASPPAAKKDSAPQAENKKSGAQPNTSKKSTPKKDSGKAA